VVAILVASVGIWLFHFMILRGVKQAAAINYVVTIAKVVPIIAFILILAFLFNTGMFRFNFYGGGLEGTVFEQVRATMFVTVFVFLGIEGASVYSRYAKERRDVGFATITGFLLVTTLMVLVTLLPYAIVPREEIAGMRHPSMAAMLEAAVGHWGAVFISVGLLVSVLGAYLAWSLICAEVLSAAARTRDMPSLFARENANQVPHLALWATNIVVQLIVITTYWSIDAFSLMLNLTSAMALIPFLLVAGYAMKLTTRGETYDTVRPNERSAHIAIAAVATVYTGFLVYAGGLKFIVLSAILYAPGSLLYVWARREQGRKVFDRVADMVIMALAVLGAIVGVYWIATGYIVL
jgi:Amino acid transporters